MALDGYSLFGFVASAVECSISLSLRGYIGLYFSRYVTVVGKRRLDYGMRDWNRGVFEKMVNRVEHGGDC